ncbi:hypothetical protein HNR46_004162 [Haloferula luteola]|uniref:Uncharacterized protein n=1 Tax=Haloferula luteola TaxID=595692 RepID=A0A840V6K8_9BACT|nr:hypothetical protein [Haloferula luteola]MBB5353897.1 hypothetical protein [Haloferula luteola]
MITCKNIILFSAIVISLASSSHAGNSGVLSDKINEFLEERETVTVEKSDDSQKEEGEWEWKLRTGSMTQQAYRDYLEKIGMAAQQSNNNELAMLSPAEREIADLAAWFMKRENQIKCDELVAWYGGYAHELPDKYLEEYMSPSINAARKLGATGETLGGIRKGLRKGPKNYALIIPYRPPVVELRDEHVTDAYLPAWEFWLMAPPSRKRDFIGGRINKALLEIGDENVIPLLVEAAKNDAKSWKGRTIDSSPQRQLQLQQDTLFAYTNLICSMPREKTLDALLEINRYAIANDLNGEDYYKSITRHIIRRLASRRAYADQLIDPKMQEIIARQDRNEEPEDIPLTDELWKDYKPLLEASLAAKTDETPQADIELITSALEIMPEE